MPKKTNETYEIGTKGTWKGMIKSVVYIGQNNYAIISLDIINGPNITAEGKIVCPQKNAMISVTGKIVYSDKYKSKQIHVDSSIVSVSDDVISAMRFLTSGGINGVGIKIAEELISLYGSDLDSYMTDSAKLTAISGISAKKCVRIIASYEANKHLIPIYKVTKGNTTYNQAEKIYGKYGEKSVDAIKNNPYQLIYDLDNFGFITADNLALSSGYDFDGKERICAAISHALKQAASNNGNMYLPLTEVYEKVMELVYSLKELKSVYYKKVLGASGVPDDTSDWDVLLLPELIKEHKKKLESAISKWDDDEFRNSFCKKEKLSQDEIDCIDFFYDARSKSKSLIDYVIKKESIEVGNNHPADIVKTLSLSANSNVKFVIETGKKGERSIFEKNEYLTECAIAEKIAELISSKPLKTVSSKEIDEAIKCIEKDESSRLGFEFKLDKDQETAVKNALTSRISVITGGPGRGKTTIIKAAIKAWEKEGYTVILLAPTGKAAKRMSEATGHAASTVHRFLLRNRGGIQNNKTLIFIDESSMLDALLANWLLSNIINAQICFVGDVDQLPSVGPGAFLEDLIRSNKVVCSFLIHCHRNAGSILSNSDVINEGKRIQELVVDNHFKTLWVNDAAVAIQNALSIYKSNLDKYGAENMIVLTPMRERNTGVNSLNQKLQEIVNPAAPGKKEINIGTINVTTFREGDRVIQTRNNYNINIMKENSSDSKGVFNGETGCISEIDYQEAIVTVLFDDGKEAYYNIKDMDELSLAYALTYHKSQGSEYPFVICMLTTADYILLQRKILYTGESRAKDKCVFIGHAKAFQMAMNDASGGSAGRNTTLAQKINQYCLLKTV